MIDILDYYKIYNERKINVGYIILMICFVILIITIVFRNINYNSYYVNSGVLIENNRLKVYVKSSDVNKIISNNILKIDNEQFAYTIYYVSDVIFTDDYYYEIIIDTRLKEKYNIKNNIINFKILLEEKTILEYILKKVGGI